MIWLVSIVVDRRQIVKRFCMSEEWVGKYLAMGKGLTGRHKRQAGSPESRTDSQGCSQAL